MSTSDEVVMQKKDDSDTVTWREYEALRDHFQGVITRSTESIDNDVQALQLKLDQTDNTINTVQTQVTELQTSIQNLTQSVNQLHLTVEQNQPQDGYVDDDSVHDNAAQLGLGCGGVVPGRGRGFAPLGGARRVPHDAQHDDGLGKPKFSIPRFEGSTDVEEYLTWELKIEKLWCLHDYTKDKKIKLASSEFDGYALRWWDSVVQGRQEDGELPIITWHTMEVMRARFVPTNYLRSVFDKLT